MAIPLNLPASLDTFREKIENTRMPYIKVKAKAAANTSAWQSKVGGQPYWPKGMAYPTGPDGNELYFLAQINFAEVPRLEPFPDKGIIQFFIADDDLYGMDFDDGENQDTFRVVFHPDVVQNDADLEKPARMMRDYDELPHHPDASHPLVFEMAEACVPVTDYRFWQAMGADFFQQFGAQEWDIMDQYGKAVNPQGHKIGGYAYFTQDDPRRPDDPMLLLFQLDSDEPMDLMWGDMGVGHFFIREKDLVARDFSRVLYDWDCL